MKVKCPYCEFDNKLGTDRRGGYSFVTCDLEEGGCDKTFVVDITITRTATAKKIEGEE